MARITLFTASVPSTYGSTIASLRVGWGKWRSFNGMIKLRCQCGNPVREGFVLCMKCEEVHIEQLRARFPNHTTTMIMNLVRRTRACDCGQPKAVNAEACPACTWRDGVKIDFPYLNHLDKVERDSATGISKALGRDIAVVKHDLARLVVRGRIVKDVEHEHNLEHPAVWYSLR